MSNEEKLQEALRRHLPAATRHLKALLEVLVEVEAKQPKQQRENEQDHLKKVA